MSDTAKIYYRRHSKSGEDVDDKFDIDVPQKTKIILFAVLGILIVAAILYSNVDGPDGILLEVWAPFVFLGLSIPVILLWGKVGPQIAQGMILKWLKKVSDKKKTTPIEFFVGFPMAVKDQYFIEANPMDFDIKKPQYFINRVKEAMFLSIGISIIIAQLIVSTKAPFIQNQIDVYGYSQNGYELVIYSAIFIGPLALLALFFILPMFWIGEDMQIYRIDALQDPYRIGSYFRNGMLSKILGFFGIVLAFNTAGDMAKGLFPTGDMMTVYTWTFIYFGFIVLSCSLCPYLVTLIYIAFFHKEAVNVVRIKASEFLPCATMQANYVSKEELQWLTHPEKLKELDKPDVTDKPAGKIIVIVLCGVSAVISFFLSFVWTW